LFIFMLSLVCCFFFSSRRRHTRFSRDWSSDVCSSDLVELDTFQVAYDIIGGGEEGSKFEVRTKEEADHSLPYLLAVALIDGQVRSEERRVGKEWRSGWWGGS